MNFAADICIVFALPSSSELQEEDLICATPNKSCKVVNGISCGMVYKPKKGTLAILVAVRVFSPPHFCQHLLVTAGGRAVLFAFFGN